MEDWGNGLFAKGVGMKWKKWVRGEGKGKEKKPSPHPAAGPNPYQSSIYGTCKYMCDFCFQIVKNLNRLQEIGISKKLTDVRNSFPRYLQCSFTVCLLIPAEKYNSHVTITALITLGPMKGWPVFKSCLKPWSTNAMNSNVFIDRFHVTSPLSKIHN